MRGIGVEEPAPIGAELLDRLLACDRAEGDGLTRTLECRRVDVASQGLRHSQRHEGERQDDRAGQ